VLSRTAIGIDAFDDPDFRRAGANEGPRPVSDKAASDRRFVAPLDQEVREILEMLPRVKISRTENAPHEWPARAFVGDSQQSLG